MWLSGHRRRGRDILGLWAGDGDEGAKFWLQVLTELKNRGVTDVCIGLRRVESPRRHHHSLGPGRGAVCIIHVIRNTFWFASRKYRDQISHARVRSTPPPPEPKPSCGLRSSTRKGASPWSGVDVGIGSR
jgi:hypothetical protein